MKIEYDKEADAAYIYIEHPIGFGQVSKTVELNEDIAIDFDKTGKLLGIEILDASKVLDKKILIKAETPQKSLSHY